MSDDVTTYEEPPEAVLLTIQALGGERWAEHHNVPQWQCHKRVRAARVMDIKPLDELKPPERGSLAGLALYLEGIEQYLEVGYAWAMKHGADLRPGAYVVFYEDGYMSVSPASAFEPGYAQIEPGSPRYLVLLDLAMASAHFEGPVRWEDFTKELRTRYAAVFDTEE